MVEYLPYLLHSQIYLLLLFIPLKIWWDEKCGIIDGLNICINTFLIIGIFCVEDFIL
jgi:hypothetical protein